MAERRDVDGETGHKKCGEGQDERNRGQHGSAGSYAEDVASWWPPPCAPGASPPSFDSGQAWTRTDSRHLRDRGPSAIAASVALIGAVFAVTSAFLALP